MRMVALIFTSGVGFHPWLMADYSCNRAHDPSPGRWPLKLTHCKVSAKSQPRRGVGLAPTYLGTLCLASTVSRQTLTLNKVRK